MLLLYPIESVALTIVFRRLSPNIVCQVEKTVVMKAFGIINASAGGGIDMLMEFPLPVPQLRPRDILVAVDAPPALGFWSCTCSMLGLEASNHPRSDDAIGKALSNVASPFA